MGCTQMYLLSLHHSFAKALLQMCQTPYGLSVSASYFIFQKLCSKLLLRSLIHPPKHAAQHVNQWTNQGATLYYPLEAKTVSFIILPIGEPYLQQCVHDHKKEKHPFCISLSEWPLQYDPFHSQSAHPGDKGIEVFHNLQLLHIAEGTAQR